MPVIDLSKLVAALSEDQSNEDIESIYRKLDRLTPQTEHPSWAQSTSAIVSLCMLLFGLLATGLTGYLNLKEPLNMATNNIQLLEKKHDELCSRISRLEIKTEQVKDIIGHNSIRIDYSVERTKSRLNKIEKFIVTSHGVIVLDGDK